MPAVLNMPAGIFTFWAIGSPPVTAIAASEAPESMKLGIMKSSLHIIATVFVCWTLVACASQRDIRILDERLAILERQNQEIQRQYGSVEKQISRKLDRLGKTSQDAETTLRGNYAKISANLDAMRSEVQLLSGRIEETSHFIDVVQTDSKQLQEKMNELELSMAKLDQRMAEVEHYLNFDTSGSKAGAGKAKAAASKDTDEKGGAAQLYAKAKQAYDNGQLDQARQQFQELIKTYPKSSTADNAQFWIGETYYKEKWYEKAILEYQAVIDKYPKGNKVAAAMLKQGMAFLQIDDKSAARLRFQELEKRYPQTNEAKIAVRKLKEF